MIRMIYYKPSKLRAISAIFSMAIVIVACTFVVGSVRAASDVYLLIGQSNMAGRGCLNETNDGREHLWQAEKVFKAGSLVDSCTWHWTPIRKTLGCASK